jgi:hypothetical protein
MTYKNNPGFEAIQNATLTLDEDDKRTLLLFLAGSLPDNMVRLQDDVLTVDFRDPKSPT